MTKRCPIKSRASCAAYYAANRQKIMAHRAKKREENREKLRAGARIYAAAHREEARKKTTAWRIANPERHKNALIAWRKIHPGYNVPYKQKRRARERLAEGSFTAADLKKIRVLQRDKCAVCKSRLHGMGHCDHVTPLARGGSNWPENIQLLCGRCNQSKGARSQVEFAQSRGMLL